MYYCNTLRCADNSFYVGVSEDPAQRLHVHNQGQGSSWTAARRPVRLVWTEEHPTRPGTDAVSALLKAACALYRSCPQASICDASRSVSAFGVKRLASPLSPETTD